MHNHPRKRNPPPRHEQQQEARAQVNIQRRKKAHNADHRTKKERQTYPTYKRYKISEHKKDRRRKGKKRADRNTPKTNARGGSHRSRPNFLRTNNEKKKRQEARSETPASPADHVCRGRRLTRMHHPSDYLWGEQRR